MTHLDAIADVLFIGAHPDDESVLAGGLLAMLHEEGVGVHIVCVTDGRGGEGGGVPGADHPEGRARIRELELRCAVEALGAISLELLGYEDPPVGPDDALSEFEADEDTLVRQIADQIWLRDVEVVLSHGSNGEYGHPAHMQVHRAVLRAIRERAPHILFYSVGARVPTIEDRLWNASDPAHLALDITPWIETKHAALMCHRTQHALFMRRRNLPSVRAAIRTVEAVHRHWPVVTPGEPPDDAFAQLLLTVGAWRPAHES